MINKPLVSVVIPSYNPDNYIFRAIDSVLNQTYKNIEIIVVDDWSEKVNLEVLLKDYIESDKIKFYKKKNWWPWSARNFWVEKSNWEYIAFLDDDDEYLQEKIEKQINAVLKEGFEIVLTNWYTVDINWNKKEFIRKSKKAIDFLKNDERILLFPWLMISKKIFKQIWWIPNVYFWEDRLFIMTIFDKYFYKIIDDFLFLIFENIINDK